MRISKLVFWLACGFSGGLGKPRVFPRERQAISQLCTPKITANKIVASPKQRYDAGQKAEPPVTDTNNAVFAWPDTPMGVIKTADGYEFFGSDGGFHARQMWQGHWVGNNKWGSVVTTAGTLDNPLGTGDPQDVSISPNPDPAVNPNYSSYQYMGGGPVYQVPAGMTGAGNLLVTYHAELPDRRALRGSRAGGVLG